MSRDTKATIIVIILMALGVRGCVGFESAYKEDNANIMKYKLEEYKACLQNGIITKDQCRIKMLELIRIENGTNN